MSLLRRVLPALALVTVMAPRSVMAQFVNPGFETPVLGSGAAQQYNTGGDIGGWTVVGVSVTLLQTAYSEGGHGVAGATQQFPAHSGNNSLDLTGPFNTGSTNGVQQSVATTIGQMYTISFWVGKATGGSPFYIDNATVDVSIDGGARASFTNSSNANPSSIIWEEFSTQFVASKSSTLVTFFNGTNNEPAEVGLDDVSINNAAVVGTPEPSSIALLATGLIGITGVARRRRRAE